jgi:hypothetical protein
VGLGLGVRGAVRIGATIAGCALVAACTSEQPPTVTPTPTASPTASPSPTASASPTETDIERQMRLDFQAAERAYRASFVEQDRLSRLGVARETAELKRTSAGSYRRVALLGLRDLEKAGWRTVNNGKIVGVTHGGWRENQVQLISCEDGSAVKLVDKAGHDVTPKNATRRFVQNLTVKKYRNDWKVTDAQSKGVKDFEGAACGP